MDYIMRKLIIAVGIFLLTTSAFGHPFSGLLCYFHERPAFEFREKPFAVKQGADGCYVYDLTPQKFKAMLDNPSMRAYLSKYTYSFFIGDSRFYMLSYDTCNIISGDQPYKIMKRVERGLFLFRLDDGGWTKASDKPVQVDFEDCSAPNEPYVAYFPWRITGDRPEDQKRFAPAKNGSVTVADNGIVTIVLVNHTNTKNGDVNRITFFNTTIVLLPTADKTYTMQ
jgi:hypothetical protein